ncbi:restriction endonuclease subunit S [Mangrovibacterium diazotrophicum]|uniref:Type I restriction enzyme S subunit n=1 Tax=Mangrovibacterium diazotrophicum TaxID=1261403 RepID=A0A419W4Q3_9BACT|nr:restriction endonuclease subunit S [Mangrovibacterium diazotrophicum]RKD90429.1 type I restriction enzyme S subunit [Mangrovibacterium diazotrophicum]
MEKSNVPINWVKIKVVEISEIIRGVSYSKNDATSIKSESNCLILRGGNIQDGNVVIDDDCVYVDSGLVKSSQFLRKNDIVIVGSTGSKALIGKAAICNEDRNDIAFGAFLMLLRPNKLITGRYFDYFFLSDFYRQEIRQLAGGININNIRKEHIENLVFPLPPLAEQQRIVAKLDSLFARIEKLKASMERIPQLLKDFRQAVLTQAVTGKLTEEWREGRELEEWESSSIGKLFDVKTGATPNRSTTGYYSNGTIPWLKSGQVKNELIFEAEEYITEIAVKETNAKIFPIDTLLVAMYGEGKTRGQVGWMKLEAATNQAVAALVNEAMPLITRSYVFFYCLSQYNEIRAKAEGGNQPNLNLSKIKNWEIQIPSIDEQKEIVRRVESLFAKADSLEAQYQNLKGNLEQLPQALLAKAFRGELVEQLPTDGDARDLLAEIQELKGETAAKGRSRTSTAVRKKSTIKNMDIESIIKEHFKDEKFSFDDLKRVTKGDYETIQKKVFELLKRKKGWGLVQEFDDGRKQMMLKSRNYETKKG